MKVLPEREELRKDMASLQAEFGGNTGLQNLMSQKIKLSHFQPFPPAKYFQIKIQPGDSDQYQNISSMTWPQSRDQVKLMAIRSL